MYNQQTIKELFKRAGVKIEIQDKIQDNCFSVKINNGNKIYIWNNTIVNKVEFDNNTIQYYQNLNK